MYGTFVPMSTSTIEFAKSYRAEQIRAAEQSRVAAMFKPERHGISARIHAAWTAATSHVRHTQGSAVPEYPRPAH